MSEHIICARCKKKAEVKRLREALEKIGNARSMFGNGWDATTYCENQAKQALEEAK